MAIHSSQGVYAPLPQSLSDSESEKDVPITRAKFTECHLQNGLHDGARNGYVSPSLQLPDVHKTATMSPKRKFCFVLSIAVCFLTIIVFLWVLPCSESGTCPVKISNWENQHDGIELTGKINSVKSAFKNTLNLVLFFRKNLNASDGQNGVISVLGHNGAVAWYVRQTQMPHQLDCHILDANGDNIEDCLVLGAMGLEAIDPISGSVFWHAHNHTNGRAMVGLDFPHRLQDLNRDNINELLTTKNSLSEPSKFIIISGKSGMLEGEISLESCDEAHVVYMNGTSVVYQCFKDGVIHPPKTNFVAKSHNGYTLNGRRLIINNVGRCPLNCRVEISLLNEKSGQDIISWSYQNSYALMPALFSFQPSRTNLNSLKGHINGFILKLWQWFGYNKSKQRLNYTKDVYADGNLTQINSIMERIVLITFNETNFHVINASLTEITQLCFPATDQTLPNCQPSLANQNDSLLISDLDVDGSQELVSYSSTFVRREGLPDRWQLVSNMKVIRLEAELPKLYEAK